MTGMSANDVKQTMQHAKETIASIGATIPLDSVLNLPEWKQLHADVFSGSTDLETLRDYARASYVAPTAFLMVTLTRIAAVSYPLTVDSGTGTTPLNTYLTLVGDSGMGKDTVINKSACAYSFTRTGFPVELRERPLGTGESLVSAYMPPAPDKDNPMPPPSPRVLFVETEVSNAETLMKREGATLRQNFLKLYSGGVVGNATKTSVDTVEAGTYSAGVIIGAQRARVGALLDNPDDGLPHRFLWTELVDPTRPTDNPKCPPLPAIELPKAGTVIHACDTAKQAVKRAARLRLEKAIQGDLTHTRHLPEYA